MPKSKGGDDDGEEAFGFGGGDVSNGKGTAAKPTTNAQGLPPGYAAVDPEKIAVKAKAGDNSHERLMSEDPRAVDGSKEVIEDFKVTRERPVGYLSPLGKGQDGGRIGAIAGKKKSVTSAESKARTTLITQQPGKPRSKDGYVPYNTPKATHKPGHVLFRMDVPKVVGRGGTKIDKSSVVRRIIVNANQDKGAQMTIEEYVEGRKAKKGDFDKDTKEWIKANGATAITREVISMEVFNVSEIQRTRISQTTLSSAAETEIHVKTQVHEHIERDEGTKDKVKFTEERNPTCFGCGRIEKQSTGDYDEFPTIEDMPEGKGPGHECCCCQESSPFFGVGSCFHSLWTKTCGMDQKCCFIDYRTSKKKLGRKASITKSHTNEDHESKTEDPFHLVNVHKLQFFLKDSAAENSIDFTWRVQSIGETETDMHYEIAHELAGPCQDPTSAARTLANLVHYLNA